MKVLSLGQPWAWLVVKGFKSVETRRWRTKYRGGLLIHACGKISVEMWDQMKFLIDNDYFECPPLPIQLPVGAIVGQVDLVDVGSFPYVTFRDFLEKRTDHLCVPATNYWATNIYLWYLENAVEFKEPVPCKGKQRLWNAPAEVVEAIGEG